MGLAFRISDSMGLRWGLRVCTATNLWDADAADAAVAAGLGPNSKNHFFNNIFRRKAIHQLPIHCVPSPVQGTSHSYS